MTAFDHHALVGLSGPEAEKRIRAAGFSPHPCGHHGQVEFQTRDGTVRVELDDGEVTRADLLGDA